MVAVSDQCLRLTHFSWSLSFLPSKSNKEALCAPQVFLHANEREARPSQLRFILVHAFGTQAFESEKTSSKKTSSTQGNRDKSGWIYYFHIIPAVVIGLQWPNCFWFHFFLSKLDYHILSVNQSQSKHESSNPSLRHF